MTKFGVLSNKLILLFFFLVIVDSVIAQNEKKFFCNNKHVSALFIDVKIEGVSNRMKYQDFTEVKLNAEDKLWLIYKNVDSLFLTYKSYLITDTFYFSSEIQTFSETIISNEIIKQESTDSMHVVDFHFVKGRLYTIEKSINFLDKKFFSYKKTYIEIDSKSKLLHKDIYDLPLLQIRDSIFVFKNEELQFLMSQSDYLQKFSGYIGNIENKVYFKNTYFYNLIDEVSYFNKVTDKENFIGVYYDSSSFHFISQNYKNLTPMRGLPVYLYYDEFHRKSGRYFTGNKHNSIAKLNVRNAQVFKHLKGSKGFLNYLKILEESRMEAKLLDSVLLVFDFNKNEINYYYDDILIKNIQLNSESFWYRNKFYSDYKRKKGYFLVLQNNKQEILEINYLNGKSRLIPLLRGIHSLNHWEINDGRIYLLKKESNTGWIRRLYSYNVNDFRLN